MWYRRTRGVDCVRRYDLMCHFTFQLTHTLACKGHKSSVHTHLNYLVIVSPPFVPSASSASATVRNLWRNDALSGNTDYTKVTVFDLENKFIAYSGAFSEGVREVVSQWDQIYILPNDGKVSLFSPAPAIP